MRASRSAGAEGKCRTAAPSRSATPAKRVNAAAGETRPTGVSVSGQRPGDEGNNLENESLLAATRSSKRLRRGWREPDENCNATNTPRTGTSSPGRSSASPSQDGNDAQTPLVVEPNAHHAAAADAVTSAPPAWCRGNIYRIRLTDFLTFDDVEIRPGPRLNLVIGPNGSGKSSIVAAICIALGGRLELIGRSSNLGLFVKHGKSRASVEVALYDPDVPQRSRVVQRVFTRDNRSEFWVDRRRVSKQVVEELVRTYEIQLDNICSFLPQERVVEFVESTPQEMLRNTIRAVYGSTELERFEQVSRAELQLQEERSQAGADEQRLQELVRQNEALEAEVRFFEEREALMQQVQNMLIYRPYCLYEIARQEALAQNDAFKEADAAFQSQRDAFERECAPLREKQRQWLATEKRVKALRAELAQRDQRLQQRLSRLSELALQFEDESDALARIDADARERERNHAACQRQVEQLRREWQAAAGTHGDPETLTHRLEQLRQERADLSRHIGEASGRARELQRSTLQPLQQEREEKRAALEQLQNVRQRRLEVIQRRHPHVRVWEAYRYMEEQRQAGRFRGAVWGPIPLEISARDRLHSDVLETVLSGWLEVTFVFESSDDERMVFQESRRNHWRINTIGLPRAEFRPAPPARLEQVRHLGVRGFLYDCFEAPENFKRAVADAAPLHLIAVADAAAAQHLTELALHHRIFLVFTADGGYRSRVSRYDAHNVSTRIESALRHSGLYAGADERQIEALATELCALDARHEQAQRQLREWEERETQLRVEERQRQQRLAELTESHRQVEHARQRLEMQERTLHTMEEEMRDGGRDEARRRQRRAHMKRQAREYLSEAIEAGAALSAVGGDADEVARLTAVATDQQRVVYAGEQRMSAAAQVVQRREQERQVARERLLEAKRVVKQRRAEAERQAPLTEQLTRQLREWQYPENVEALDELIARTRARAEALTDVSSETVEVYERRRQQIEQLRLRLASAESNLQARTEQVQRQRADTVRQLRALISRMSRAFGALCRRLDCAGDIALSGEDAPDSLLGHLAVSIRVKYRAEEPLRELSAAHHSGGEKMVATMLYLFAMQGMARAAFRVVDEMNQGMDPHNERAVLSMMMQLADVPDAVQTFLISPKLLLHLPYSQHIVVHCVLNGPFALTHRAWHTAEGEA